jgi:hypothetical protein
VVTNPDPGLAASMAAYDAAMDLPPANVTEMALPGKDKPSAVCQIECSTGEDRLDAEAIHSMAPYANIVFVHPPVPETIGMQGWPEVAQAIEMIADQHLADVITVSLGDGENDFINDPTNPAASQQAAIHSLDPAFLDAAARGIPVMFASGDCGPADPPVRGDTGQCTGYDIASGWGTIYAPAFVPALVAQIDSQHGPDQPSRQARDALSQLQASISTSAGQVASGRTVTVTGNGFIPGRSPNGTTIEDGFGVFPPLPGQFGVTSGPYADPASTVPGQTWDDVRVTVTGTGPDLPVHAPVVTGPDGNGTVTVIIDTTGMAAGTYTVTITGRLLTQTMSFQVKNPDSG